MSQRSSFRLRSTQTAATLVLTFGLAGALGCGTPMTAVDVSTKAGSDINIGEQATKEMLKGSDLTQPQIPEGLPSGFENPDVIAYIYRNPNGWVMIRPKPGTWMPGSLELNPPTWAPPGSDYSIELQSMTRHGFDENGMGVVLKSNWILNLEADGTFVLVYEGWFGWSKQVVRHTVRPDQPAYSCFHSVLGEETIRANQLFWIDWERAINSCLETGGLARIPDPRAFR